MIAADPCVCGKKYSFATAKEAWDYIRSVDNSKLSRPLVGVVICSEKIGVYHTTTKTRVLPNKFSKLEMELHQEMATARDLVIEYAKKKFDASGDYKCLGREAQEYVKAKNLKVHRNAVDTAIYDLKKKGILTELDEKAPGRGAPKYFALTSILDAVTQPKKEEEVAKVESKVPAQPAPPVNPFDRVNEQLNEILTKVNGLANGYSELVSKPTVTAEAFVTGLEESVAKVADSVKLQFQLARAIDDDQYKTLLQAATSHVTVDGDKLADVVNARLQNLKLDDSFIYRIREEVMTGYEHLVNQIQVPPTVANSDDYRAGIKEGIRLAVEMGLRID